MVDYLYYKLYQATLKGSLRDMPRFTTSVYFASLISVNLLVINVFLAKIDILPFFFSNKRMAGGLVIILTVLSFLYYSGDRLKNILHKYNQESKSARRNGNLIVAIYVALSFLLIFAVAFFRPGKL